MTATVAVAMTVTMTVALRSAGGVGKRLVRRQIDHVTVAHPALGNDMVGKLLHVGPAPFEHRDFETARLVEVHVQGRLRQIVARVVVAGEPPRQLPLLVLVNVNERP